MGSICDLEVPENENVKNGNQFIFSSFHAICLYADTLMFELWESGRYLGPLSQIIGRKPIPPPLLTPASKAYEINPCHPLIY